MAINLVAGKSRIKVMKRRRERGSRLAVGSSRTRTVGEQAKTPTNSGLRSPKPSVAAVDRLGRSSRRDRAIPKRRDAPRIATCRDSKVRTRHLQAPSERRVDRRGLETTKPTGRRTSTAVFLSIAMPSISTFPAPRSRGVGQESVEMKQQRALARTVGTDQGHAFPLRYRQIHASGAHDDRRDNDTRAFR